ncbi:hypothetical protein BIW11_04803 [Tropilaelaps mercedesae]|uniref:Uncharacterized protein n=1 Tax=Tropilaelaps mercedesae TaxID=418985 RepID=A0A1V9X1I7_9ACAR|nr:hypothetical protein BIW11_04803 [Tropilaelaps mercedesae]
MAKIGDVAPSCQAGVAGCVPASSMVNNSNPERISFDSAAGPLQVGNVPRLFDSSVLSRNTNGRLRMATTRPRYDLGNVDGCGPISRCGYEPTNLKHIKEMLMNTWTDLGEARSKKKTSEFVVSYFERRIAIYNELLRNEFERFYADHDSDELTIIESDSDELIKPASDEFNRRRDPER